MQNIRNFSIIAHIDHGKSTLADRMLEITKTIEKRKMKDQVLDSMDLERERGITIKMQPVRVSHHTGGLEYELNLIDTPGHIDFSYEVSRALKAVEGVLLLVDATQGVQAQTLTTLHMAKDLGLVIIPVLSKVDSPLARVDDVSLEIAELLECSIDDIVHTSGKTGQGVEELLDRIVSDIPAPKTTATEQKDFRSLVFDFEYSEHRGVIVYVRAMEGSIKKGNDLIFKVAGKKFCALEVGIFSPDMIPVNELSSGEIGYIITGIKEEGVASVGDTVSSTQSKKEALAGYMKPSPVVWASLYPESQDDFPLLTQALNRLSLTDSSLSFDEEMSGVLGRGYRCGFLGMLHMEIVVEQLKRMQEVDLIVTTPSITYKIITNKEERMIYTPVQFPDDGSVEKVYESWVDATIISPAKYTSIIMQLLFEHGAQVKESENFGDARTSLHVAMPLRELMRGFFDKLKSVTSGFASISYDITDMKEADVVRLDIFVAEELVPAFSRIVARSYVEEEAKKLVEKLHENLPRQMFTTKIQAKAMGRILSSRTLSALKKNVTAHLYGGDITRKMKLREKQKRGKKKMAERGKVRISQDVFMKMMRPDSE